MPGFTAPKLLWVRLHEPKIFDATAKVLLPKDYVRLRMTGELASDMSDSAGTLWLDVAQRRWSDAMLAGTGLDGSHMPALFEGNEITGELRAELAEAWGMSRVPVVAGGGDNAAGAVGVGVVRPGDAFLSLGTSGVLFLANDGYRPNPAGGVHTFCHAVPKHWHQMSVILSAASCVDWAARLCGLADAAAVFALAEARDKPSGGEIFLPYLSGERTPHNDPNEQLRMAVCYWHTFGWDGFDIFGAGTFKRPWHGGPLNQGAADHKLNEAFEFFTRLGLPYFCFHDVDVMAQAHTIREHVDNFLRMVDQIEAKMAATESNCCGARPGLFSHPRYMAGGAADPDPEVFRFAATQVRQCLEATHRLHGENYVLWGGRETDTLLNTSLKQEKSQSRPVHFDGGGAQAQDRLQGPDPDRAQAARADQASIRF